MIQLGLTLPFDTVLIVVMVVLLLVWVVVELRFEGMIRNVVRIFSALALCVLFMLYATAAGMIVW